MASWYRAKMCCPFHWKDSVLPQRSLLKLFYTEASKFHSENLSVKWYLTWENHIEAEKKIFIVLRHFLSVLAIGRNVMNVRCVLTSCSMPGKWFTSHLELRRAAFLNLFYFIFFTKSPKTHPPESGAKTYTPVKEQGVFQHILSLRIYFW